MNRNSAIASRVREIREELFGANGLDSLAKALNVPVATWQNYERGVTIPGEVLLAFVVVVGVNPNWLLTGEGERFVSAGNSLGVRQSDIEDQQAKTTRLPRSLTR